MLKKELKVLQSKLFKIKCENKSLYECLSKTEFQCSESLILKKFQEMEDYFKISQEVIFLFNF